MTPSNAARAVVVRGLPGTGKTTLSAELQELMSPAVHLNVDVLRDMTRPRLMENRHIEAMELAAAEQGLLLAAQGYNVILDSVFLSVSTVFRIVERYGAARLPTTVCSLEGSLELLLEVEAERDAEQRIGSDRVRELFPQFEAWPQALAAHGEGLAKRIAETAPEPMPVSESIEVAIARHGQAEIDRDRYPEDYEVGLSALGRHQAQSLANSASRQCYQRVVSSPLPRALETAEIVADRLGVELETDERLSERIFECFHGRSYREIERTHGAWFLSQLRNASDRVELPGVESLKAAGQRSTAALEAVIATRRSTIIVTHGGPHAWMLCSLCDLPFRRNRQFYLAKGHATVLRYREARFERIVRVNGKLGAY